MDSNPYDLDSTELMRHADSVAAGNGSPGPEAIVVDDASGFSMRTAAYPADASYVRVCAPDGVEIAYFDEVEFANDPANTLGALFAHVARGPLTMGIRLKGVVDAPVSDEPTKEPMQAFLVASGEPADNPHGLLGGEIVHRDAVAQNGDDQYDPETIVVSRTTRFQLRIPIHEDVDYVRVCDPDGRETAYWTRDEFAESPSEVISAMFGAVVRGV